MGVEVPSNPINRKEQYLAKIAGQAVDIPAEPITREEAYLDYIAKHGGGGGGGTNDYDDLLNQPKINDVTLKGNKSLSDLGIASASALANKVDKVAGKDLSSNDYSDSEKQKNADNATAISAIKDGAIIDSFADVESALSNKQDTLTFDDVPTTNSNNPVKSGGVKSAIDAAVASAYHHAGTKTCVELVAGLLVAGNEGNVYNMTDSGTTTSDFIEGQGQPIKAGDNVGIAKISDGVYKFDLLSGFVDTTNFVQKSVTAGLLKNDGTVNDEIEGDVATLKSGLTNLDNEVNGDSTTYPYADVITIPDAVPANLADCTVKIEPVQDLHGYDHPWVGGAGKNLMPNPLNNGVVGSNGSYSSRDDRITNVTKSFDNILPIKAGTYTISADGLDSCTVLTKDASDNIVDNFANSWNNLPYTFTLTADAFLYVSLRKNNNDNISPNDYQVQVESGSTATSYEPYTNICPITGHTEASVQRDGRNLFDPINVETFDATGQGDMRYGHRYNSGTYTIVNNMASESIFVRQVKTDLSEYGQYSTINALNYATINVNDGYMLYVYYQSLTEEQRKNVCVNKGNDTTFVPYQGKTYTIALGDTIYGGTVDFDSGVMTVTHYYVTKNTSTMNNLEQYPGWTGSGIKQIVGGGIDDVVSTCVNVSDVIRANTLNINDILFFEKNDIGLTQTELIALAIDVAFVVELATPTIIQLTPKQIQMLKGQNTITASTGQISVTVNGVSGSIGQVQEQVNELAGDVAKLHYHKVAECAATGTRADKLASLYSTYNTLKNDVRKSAILLRNNADIYHAVNNSGTFSNVYVDTNSVLLMCITLNPGSYFVNNNGTTTDGSSTENTEVYSLWIIE